MLRSRRNRLTATAFATVVGSLVWAGTAVAAECQVEVIGESYPNRLSCSVYGTGTGTCVVIDHVVYEVIVRCGPLTEVIVRAD